MKKFDLNDLRLDIVNVTTAAINNSDNKTLEEHKPESLQFTFGFDKKLNLDEEKIMVNFFSQIVCFDQKNNPTNINALFQTQFIFRLNDLKKYISKNEKIEDTYNLNPDIIGTVLNIAYSTSRGIIYTRCLGTVMGNVILPIISVNNLIEIGIESEKIPKSTNKGKKKVETKTKSEQNKIKKLTKPTKDLKSKKHLLKDKK